MNNDDEFEIECEPIKTVLQKHNFCQILTDNSRRHISGYISDIDPFDPLNFRFVYILIFFIHLRKIIFLYLFILVFIMMVTEAKNFKNSVK